MADEDLESMSAREQMLRELESMVRHASGRGQAIPRGVLELIERASDGDHPTPPTFAEIGAGHQILAGLVAPALPRTVYLLDPYREPESHELHRSPFWMQIFGLSLSIPLIRNLMIVALLSLAALIGLQSSGYASSSHQGGIFELYHDLYLVSAAALGGAFHALFNANYYLSQANYEPRYDVSYWIRVVLGVVAGVMLASVIGPGWEQEYKEIGKFSSPLLALIGGFSATLVYRVLQRLVNAVESIMRGDVRDNKARTEQELRRRYASANGDELTSLRLALSEARGMLSAGGSPEQASAAIDQVIDRLHTPTDLLGGSSRDPSPTADDSSGDTDAHPGADASADPETTPGADTNADTSSAADTDSSTDPDSAADPEPTDAADSTDADADTAASTGTAPRPGADAT